ncbi:MAG: hypothetical protein IPG97_07115 [Microthrixaceae bacterium]|nr:hypothetical protein [Microthrixaceae bacterium]
MVPQHHPLGEEGRGRLPGTASVVLAGALFGVDISLASPVRRQAGVEKHRTAQNPTGRINGWKRILHILSIHYHDRITAATN